MKLSSREHDRFRKPVQPLKTIKKNQSEGETENPNTLTPRANETVRGRFWSFQTQKKTHKFIDPIPDFEPVEKSEIKQRKRSRTRSKIKTMNKNFFKIKKSSKPRIELKLNKPIFVPKNKFLKEMLKSKKIVLMKFRKKNQLNRKRTILVKKNSNMLQIENSESSSSSSNELSIKVYNCKTQASNEKGKRQAVLGVHYNLTPPSHIGSFNFFKETKSKLMKIGDYCDLKDSTRMMKGEFPKKINQEFLGRKLKGEAKFRSLNGRRGRNSRKTVVRMCHSARVDRVVSEAEKKFRILTREKSRKILKKCSSLDIEKVRLRKGSVCCFKE